MNCRYPLTGAAARRPPPRPGPQLGRGRAGLRVRPGVPAALLPDRLGQVGGDAGDHLRELDRDGRVVDEVDEHGEVGDDQPERDRHAEVRHEVAVRPDPIETSTSTAYTNVATKVPSVTWVPRSRMKLRSIRGPNWVEASVRVTQDDGEDHADDRDDRGRDRGQDLPRGVALPLITHGRREVAVVGGPVHGAACRRTARRGHDLQGGHHPQVGPEDLAAPVRAGAEDRT